MSIFPTAQIFVLSFYNVMITILSSLVGGCDFPLSIVCHIYPATYVHIVVPKRFSFEVRHGELILRSTAYANAGYWQYAICDIVIIYALAVITLIVEISLW